jgi:predicted metal-dependent phosphoesterase TrpH
MPLPEQPWGKADLHIHTDFGDGTMSIPELLDYVEQRTDLDVIAITDHDELRSSFQAREMAVRRRLRVQVIPGMEVTTLEGHLLALFLESPIPSLRPLAETIELVQRQGGVCVIPHPLSWVTHSAGESALERLALGGTEPAGIEVMNPTYAGQVALKRVQWLNRYRYQWAETGGSDAHFLAFVGLAYTRFPGSTPEDLHRSLLERTTQAVLVDRARPGQIAVRKLIRQQFRALVVLPFRLLWRQWSPLRNRPAPTEP